MPDKDSPDEDFELELEGVDPEILEHQRLRAERQVRETEARAARQELYEQSEQVEPISWDEFSQFRFTTRHLLITTAALSVVMALRNLMGCNGIFFSALGLLGFGWWYVLRREKRAAQARERLRQELEARVAAAGHGGEEPSPLLAHVGSQADEQLEDWFSHRPALSFSFSLKQVLTVMAIACVLLTIARLLGPDQAALALGGVAVGGLVIHFLGADPPPIIVFGWWVLLVLYVLMSLWAMVFA